jgi:hypothetical protein
MYIEDFKRLCAATGFLGADISGFRPQGVGFRV